MLFFFLVASAYKAYASPVPLGPEVFSSTPLTFLFGRSCNCGPQERTLFDIIRGCLLTIFACVYTSLHPNVPDPKASAMQKILRRLKMAFYMLIAPEAVIWWAMRQWYGAREIAKAVNEAQPDLKWTIAHGHFALMGGLQGIFPDGKQEVIDPDTIATNIQSGIIDPNELRFPKNQVEDRSKGDFLSKAIAALQTSWFVLECIARLQQHLLITELEVVTLAFAVLNVITYGLWWDKPLNVNCQVKVLILYEPVVQPDLVNEREEPEGSDVVEDMQLGRRRENMELVDIRPRPPGGGLRRRNAIIPPRPPERTIGLVLKEIWQLLFGLVARPFLALVLPIRDMFTCTGIEGGASHVPMFYSPPTFLFSIRLITCVIGMIFGGIHLLAWHSQFPTHFEVILWRTSSIVIVAVPFLVALFGIIAGKEYFEFTWQPGIFSPRQNPFFEAIAMVLYTLGPVLYILARISLILQAFISLRALQPGVFEAVTWTTYIPHL